MNSQITEADSQIQDWNIRLADREQSLIDQFGMLQAQIMSMAYAQQQWSSIYGSFGRYG
jgi:flagellar capping protein FliD